MPAFCSLRSSSIASGGTGLRLGSGGGSVKNQARSTDGGARHVVEALGRRVVADVHQADGKFELGEGSPARTRAAPSAKINPIRMETDTMMAFANARPFKGLSSAADTPREAVLGGSAGEVKGRHCRPRLWPAGHAGLRSVGRRNF